MWHQFYSKSVYGFIFRGIIEFSGIRFIRKHTSKTSMVKQAIFDNVVVEPGGLIVSKADTKIPILKMR
jgi:hypothetical protein